jgi:hypothetical protein
MKKAKTLLDIPALAPLDGLDPDSPVYDTRLHTALTWIHQSLDNRTLRAEAVAYMTPALQSLDEPPPLNRLEDWKFATMGKLAFLLNRGFKPSVRTGRWLLAKFHALAEESFQAPVPEPVVKAAAEPVPDPADDLLAEIVALVESGGLADQPDRPFGMLTAAEAKLPTARKVLTGLEERCGAVGKKRQKDCGAATQQVRNYIENLSAQKKPRKSAGVDAAKLVSGLEFMKEHAALQIVSIAPEQIVGAKAVLVLNAKTRKIGLYVAAKGKTLSVKGKSIVDYDEVRSTQKTLRKPETQVVEIRNAAGVKAAAEAIGAVPTTAIPLAGRIGPDILLVKAFR